ncbi:MAG: hypothetical protein Ct9H300mP1_28720 [Planctomycetaceae bacterium]|nr:MAG: hypothetical protein Ct9H300mP1_28720 [Planctomycetaceae bacterium]
MMNQRDHDGTEQAVEPTRSTRRGFVRTAALGAAGLAASGTDRLANAVEAKPGPRPKTKIRIGTRVNQSWMKSKQRQRSAIPETDRCRLRRHHARHDRGVR